MTVTVSDGSMTDAEAFGVDVSANGCSGVVFGGGGDENRPPISIPGGPYTGLAGDSVAFDGAQSYDPEGQPLRFGWNFGDGTVALGASQSHAYVRGGRYNVDLVVTEGLMSSGARTSATIADALPAHAFAPNGQTKVRLDSGKPTLCVRIEPVNGSYQGADVDFSSIVMLSAGTGLVDRIQAVTAKATGKGDRDTEHSSVCFRKQDLFLLLGKVSSRAVVTVAIEGHLFSGGKFRATLNLEVIGRRDAISASVYPNPLNPEALISFVTQKPGPVKVSIFDVGGRLLRVVHEERASTAGYHQLRLDGRGANAERLASGVYFYRVETPDGVTAGRFVIMK